MKLIFTLFIAFFVTSSALAQTSTVTSSEEKGKITAVIKTKIYCDHCIQCEDCNANIMNKVRAGNKGVRKVKVNPEENTITVQYVEGKTTLEQIRKSINDAGFDADDSPAPADKVARLDGCCRKK